TGTSGKTRIQTRPARFMWRVSARRAASIWRAVTRSGAIALRPNSPKFSENPPLAAPRMRPLNALRNLVFLGCIMDVDLQRLLTRRRGRGAGGGGGGGGGGGARGGRAAWPLHGPAAGSPGRLGLARRAGVGGWVV